MVPAGRGCAPSADYLAIQWSRRLRFPSNFPSETVLPTVRSVGRGNEEGAARRNRADRQEERERRRVAPPGKDSATTKMITG